jgi:hypothetical protein
LKQATINFKLAGKSKTPSKPTNQEKPKQTSMVTLDKGTPKCSNQKSLTAKLSNKKVNNQTKRACHQQGKEEQDGWAAHFQSYLKGDLDQTNEYPIPDPLCPFPCTLCT